MEADVAMIRPGGLTVCPLTSENVPLAYPLVSLMHPEITLERWFRYAAERLEPAAGMVTVPVAPKGVLVAETGRGYLHGLAGYQVVSSVAHDRVLYVDLLVALDIANRLGVERRVFDALGAVGEGLGCAEVHVALPERFAGPPGASQRVAECLAGNGFRVARDLLFRAVPSTPL